MSRAALPLLLALALGACDDPPDACRTAADCPAGQACSDGVCTPVLPTDTGSSDRRRDGGRDQGLDLGWPDSGRTDALTCVPNYDDKVARDELVFVVPSSVGFTVGTGITVDLKGTVSSGKTVWDLTASASDDHGEQMKLESVPAWAASAFPGATYTSLLNKGLGTHGVYKVSATRLDLVGVISAPPQQSKISYAPVVPLLKFPVQVNDNFTQTTTASGTWALTPILNQETYAVQVLGAGQVKLPKLTLDALLVKTRVDQYLYFNPLLKSTWTLFLFVSECYGTVGRVVVEGDPGSALTAVQAKERWRLASP